MEPANNLCITPNLLYIYCCRKKKSPIIKRAKIDIVYNMYIISIYTCILKFAELNINSFETTMLRNVYNNNNSNNNNNDNNNDNDRHTTIASAVVQINILHKWCRQG